MSFRERSLSSNSDTTKANMYNKTMFMIFCITTVLFHQKISRHFRERIHI